MSTEAVVYKQFEIDGKMELERPPLPREIFFDVLRYKNWFANYKRQFSNVVIVKSNRKKAY